MNIKLTLLGTGTFFVNKNSSSSAYFLETDGKKILIDCGPGTLMRLSQKGIKLEDIDYIFLTHFHADHTSDLFPLFMNFRILDAFTKNKVSKFPQIFGPKGIKTFLLKQSKVYKLLLVEGWNKIKFLEAKKSLKTGKIQVDPFKVKHIAFGIDAEGLAYRFLIDGKVIVFSGDAMKCPGLEDASKNADLFVCDSSYSKGDANSAHLDTYQVGEICQKNNVKIVILSHIYPQANNVDLAKEVKEKFSGEVIKGKDLMTVFI